jgi:hypothetical protein
MRKQLTLTALVFILGATWAGASTGTNDAWTMTSFIPDRWVAKFIGENLDLTTFRNSFGSRREPGMRHFADFGIRPTKTSDQLIEYDLNDWWYSISIRERRDENGDGLEDLIIVFTEKAKKGSYFSSKQLLITRYSETSDLIALAFTPWHEDSTP